MYAENESDHILIQYTPQGIELLETDFTTRLSKEIHSFLSQSNSFPAFMANITMDLFHKRMNVS